MAREAKSLQVLESEIQSRYPGTTTWEEGDKAHKNTWSDHNENAAGVYCGKDVLGDGGLDLQEFVDYLRANPHPNLRYIIFNHKIYHRSTGFDPEDYHGKSGHETHVHLSVGNGPDGRSTSGYDDTSPWGVGEHGNNMGDDMIGLKQGDKGEQVKALQGLLTRSGFSPGEHDGDYGSKTAAAVLAMRKSQGSSATDGINFTGAAYEQLFVALIKNQAKGIKGEPGAPGAPGKPGKDGVLKLPASVQIIGQVTAIGTGK